MDGKFSLNLTIEQCAVIVRALHECYNNDIRSDMCIDIETGELTRENVVRLQLIKLIDKSNNLKAFRP